MRRPGPLPSRCPPARCSCRGSSRGLQISIRQKSLCEYAANCPDSALTSRGSHEHTDCMVLDVEQFQKARPDCKDDLYGAWLGWSTKLLSECCSCRSDSSSPIAPLAPDASPEEPLKAKPENQKGLVRVSQNTGHPKIPRQSLLYPLKASALGQVVREYVNLEYSA